MAAPLTKLCKAASRSKYLQARQLNNYCAVRYKYWEWGEDCVHQKGDNVHDRIMGVSLKPKPHPETQIKGQFEVDPKKGEVFDKKPFPALLKKDKLYKWCVCGHSMEQPFCDGSHKLMYDRAQKQSREKVLYEPFRFRVEEDGEYWLCNCKQTNDKPFCDGTHKQKWIQDKIRR
ncbi:CDGSH-type zinc finger [Mactra antiquata]